MTLSHGEWEATDRSRNLRRSSKSHVSESLPHLEPKMSAESIAPTVVVKSPERIEREHSASPPLHRNVSSGVPKESVGCGNLSESLGDGHF